MIVTGIILMLLGLILDLGILTGLGTVLIVVGLVLMLSGQMGRQLGGRKHYW